MFNNKTMKNKIIKKCLGGVFVSLIVMLVGWKSVFASSVKMSKKEIDTKNLENSKRSIAVLCGSLNTVEGKKKEEIARRNLEGASRVPSMYSILVAAFDDVEKESRTYTWKSEVVKENWWRNLFFLKRTFLRK
jgi:hypothetical protein